MKARLLGAAVAVALAAGATLLPMQAGAMSTPADASAKGYIGFCDRNNIQITSGNVNSTPFVWKAVASASAPSSYMGAGQNAYLSIYQLRPDVDPGDWSGEQMTAASYYTTPKAPAAIATTKDDSLAQLMHDFPPMDDGLYEVRMFFGKYNSGTYSATYPATYIQVSGNTWTSVGGGTVDCAAAKSQSLEVIVGTVPPADSGGTAIPGGAVNLPSGTPGAPIGTPASKNTPQDDAVDTTSPQASPVASSKHSSGGSTGLIVGLLVGAVVLALGAGYFVRRRRNLA